jgi:N-sulfoglucosamine sulfohydrolase
MNYRRNFSKFSRREFLIQGTSAAAAGLTLSGYGCGRDAATRPNVLWLIAEDLSPDLGCYGNKLVRTPNIDRLAAESVRFTRAFVTGPVCSASRSALVTSMYQTSIGAHNHRSHRDDEYRLIEGIQPFTYYFRQAGYHTSNVVTAAPGVKGTGKTDFNFNVEKVFDGTDWSQRKDGQPFYAQINFSETHRAFQRFSEYPVDPAKVELPPYYPDHPAIREDWAMYLDSAQHLDVKIGKVLDRLEREGLRDSTIIFFFGDHGRPMPRGKQFLYEGGIRIPLVVHIPERFRPEGFTQGGVREDLASAIDITATSLKLAGIDPPINMQGQVMIGPGAKKREYIVAARDRCDETVDRIRCIRTERYKYIKNYYPERPYTQRNVYKDTSYPTLQVMRQLQKGGKLTGAPAIFMALRRPAEELYDLETDPYEIHNLAESAEHEQTVQQLRTILERWIKETGDQGDVPESKLPEEYKYRAQVDGWCTRGQCLVSKISSALTAQCSGKNNKVLRSYVTEPGELAVRFRARSKELRVNAFSWGTIQDMSDDPQNYVKVDSIADGQWHEHLVPFTIQSHLASLRFSFEDGAGSVEFDWIRLYSNAQGKGEPIARWEFA